MRESPAFDDEDLWFPAHMSAGDSFSRPLTAAGTAADDDGIGLPRRRPPASAGVGRRTAKAGTVKASSWLWLTLWGAAALSIAGYAARKEIATEWTQAWLKGHGIPSQLHFDRLSLGHASGSFVLGRPGHPDLGAGRFDADFSLNPFVSAGHPVARLKTLHLDRAFVHLSYKDGKLSFGTLDRLLHDTPAPKEIIVSDASVTIDSDYGPLHGRAAAAAHDGRLSYLSLKLPAARLDGAQGGGDFSGGEVLARGTTDNALQIDARLNAAQFDLRDGRGMVEGAPSQSIRAQGVSLDVSGRVSQGRNDVPSGPFDAAIDLTARGLRARGVTVTDADYHLKLNGRLSDGGLYDGLAAVAAHIGRVTGRGMDARQVAIAAARLDVHTTAASFELKGSIRAKASRLGRRGVTVTAARFEARDFALAVDGGDSHSDFDGILTAEGAHAGDLALSHTTATLGGAVDSHMDFGGWSLKAHGSLASDVSYSGLRGVRFLAKGVNLLADGRNARVWLSAPAEADLADGGALTLTALPAKPVFATDALGGFNLTLKDAGVQASLDVDDLALTPDATFGGDYRLDGRFSLGPVQGAKMSARGRFSTAGVAAGRIDGTFGALAVDTPGARLALSDGQGTVSIAGGDIRIDLDGATLSDTSSTARFRPLVLNGAVTAEARAVSGHFTAATANFKTAGKPTPVAAITLDGDTVMGRGQLGVRTLGLDFVPGGLQPRDLSPMGPAQASGSVRFDGLLRWDGRKTAVSGALTIDGLSFGRAGNLRGEIDFTSLDPLLSRPDEVLGIDRLDIGLPLTDLAMRLQVLGDHIAVDGATARTPGGLVRLEPMRVAFDPRAPVEGAVAFDGLDFGKIVAASRLSDRLTFEGRLSGRVPFTILGGHATFGDGWVKGDGPGEMSIKRQALSGLVAGGSVSAEGQARPALVPPGADPFPELAYQALAHLHYDRLDATLAARPGEGFDAQVHLQGRFAPPQPQKARMNLADYLDGAWVRKPLDLPSDTPVELYLDVPGKDVMR